MTYAPSTHKFAMGIGASGAMVEVTSDVLLNEGGITRRWGRQATFSDTSPGQFAFTLDNRDGKYTPDNVNSPLSTKVTEGMRVSWELNGALRSGKISATQLIFPSQGKTDAARLRVTVSDGLADAARTDVDVLAAQAVIVARPYAFWPFDDAPGYGFVDESSGNRESGLRYRIPDFAGVVYTAGKAIPSLNAVGLEVAVPTAPGPGYNGAGVTNMTRLGPYEYAAGSLGYWSWWASIDKDSLLSVSFGSSTNPSGADCIVTAFGAGNVIFRSLGGGYIDTPNAIKPGVQNHFEVAGTVVFTGTWDITWELFLNGTSLGTIANPSVVNPQTDQWRFSANSDDTFGTPPNLFTISNAAHTRSRTLGYAAGSPATAATRLVAIAAAAQVTLDTLPTDLSESPLGASRAGSALDLMNEVIRGEQGHLWSVTSGTLLAPVEKVRVRARTRPEAVTATFSTSADIEGAPDLQRNTTNMVSAVTVSGPEANVTVYQRDLEARVGPANASATVGFANTADLEAFGQDRILRGINRGIDVLSFDIDPGGTTANRWAELMGLTPGLRYRVADLPIAQLGVSTRDGWFLGAAESHDGDRSMFTLYFEPVLERTAIYDTDRYMAGGVLSLSSNITNSATSMSIATSTPGTTFTTAGGDLPLDIVMGTEQMRVTAVTSATPQVFTVTRGVNGTTATSHTSGELLELVTNSLYAY